MNITIIGSGYVGLVAGACFATMGNDVILLDNNENKIKDLNNNKIPIYEDGLEQLIINNKSHITFTSDKIRAIKNAEIIFIAVGTPMGEDGSCDLQFVRAVAKDIGSLIEHYCVIVNKSTVPVGSAKMVKNIIASELKKRNLKIGFDVISNPEFLKEGVAIKDFMSPDRVVIGFDSMRALEIMKNLYAPFLLKSDRLLSMSLESAEMCKYASNAMLATKISFINEIAQICEQTGANINEVRLGLGADSRIGYSFIYPGCGYGGSCFPKDVRALIKTANDVNLNPLILNAVESVNTNQKLILAQKIKTHFGDLTNRIICIWGLAFKPQTDDCREASSIVIIKELIESGAKIQAYDPKARASGILFKQLFR